MKEHKRFVTVTFTICFAYNSVSGFCDNILIQIECQKRVITTSALIVTKKGEDYETNVE